MLTDFKNMLTVDFMKNILYYNQQMDTCRRRILQWKVVRGCV
jgi:hypothetical protein